MSDLAAVDAIAQAARHGAGDWGAVPEDLRAAVVALAEDKLLSSPHRPEHCDVSGRHPQRRATQAPKPFRPASNLSRSSASPHVNSMGGERWVIAAPRADKAEQLAKRASGVKELGAALTQLEKLLKTLQHHVIPRWAALPDHLGGAVDTSDAPSNIRSPVTTQREALREVCSSLRESQRLFDEFMAGHLTKAEKRHIGLNTHRLQSAAERAQSYQYYTPPPPVNHLDASYNLRQAATPATKTTTTPHTAPRDLPRVHTQETVPEASRAERTAEPEPEPQPQPPAHPVAPPSPLLPRSISRESYGESPHLPASRPPTSRPQTPRVPSLTADVPTPVLAHAAPAVPAPAPEACLFGEPDAPPADPTPAAEPTPDLHSAQLSDVVQEPAAAPIAPAAPAPPTAAPAVHVVPAAFPSQAHSAPAVPPPAAARGFQPRLSQRPSASSRRPSDQARTPSGGATPTSGVPTAAPVAAPVPAVAPAAVIQAPIPAAATTPAATASATAAAAPEEPVVEERRERRRLDEIRVSDSDSD